MRTPTKKEVDQAVLLVKQYILMEYDSGVVMQIEKAKYKNVIHGYVKNCISLNNSQSTIPNMANHLVRFIKDSI
jgi:hypothetical protein